MLPPRIRLSQRVSMRAWNTRVEMCYAWLLRSHHGLDEARAHTGYAYGHTAEAELRPRPRCTPQLGLALRPPSRSSCPRRCRRSAWARNHTPSAESACEVTRPRRTEDATAKHNALGYRLASLRDGGGTMRGGASDGVFFVSPLCAVKVRLRRLCTSNLGVNHSRAAGG